MNNADDIVDGIGTKGWTCWPWHIAAAHNRGLFVFPYTINKNWEMEILSHFKADGYITDQPEKALKFLQRFYELPEITDIINTEEKNE